MDWSPVAAALSAITVEWLQPLNVVLAVAIIMFGRFMHKANQRPDFNLVDSLRGPDGKASMKLIGYLVGIILGSWALMNCAGSWLQQPQLFAVIFGIYMGVLVAPKILAEYISTKYGNREPKKDA